MAKSAVTAIRLWAYPQPSSSCGWSFPTSHSLNSPRFSPRWPGPFRYSGHSRTALREPATMSAEIVASRMEAVVRSTMDWRQPPVSSRPAVPLYDANPAGLARNVNQGGAH